MRTLGIITTSRADYGIYKPLLRKLSAQPDFRVKLLVGGTHLLPQFGMTVREIEQDKFEIAQRVKVPIWTGSPESIAQAMGKTTAGFAKVFARNKFDLVVVLGDRFEMHAAAVATLPFLLPLAHIAGGSVTAMAFDDSFRHSITKFSHLHFPETKLYAKRILAMGEEPWRITVTGALALDHLNHMEWLSWDALRERFRIRFVEKPIIITFHPETRDYCHTERHMDQLLSALHQLKVPLIFSAPNADTSSDSIRKKLMPFIRATKSACFVENFGQHAYFSLMKVALAMVGNSSSGIVEAPSFHLPVVNVGRRQEGRTVAGNVISVACEKNAIFDGIQKALSPRFRREVEKIRNPYGDGHAADKMIRILRSVPLGQKLLCKKAAEIR